MKRAIGNISIPPVSGDQLRAALGGDPAASEWVRKHFLGKVLGYIMAKFPDDSREEAEELLSEVLVRLARCPPRLSHSGSRATASLSCWITKVVASCAFDRQKARKAAKRNRGSSSEVNLSQCGEEGVYADVGDDELLEGGPDLEAKARYRGVFETALGSLREEEAVFIRKYYQEELTLAEAARASGIKTGQTGECRERFKAALAEALERYTYIK